jgi:hypothetical protein
VKIQKLLRIENLAFLDGQFRVSLFRPLTYLNEVELWQKDGKMFKIAEHSFSCTVGTPLSDHG